VRIVQGMSTSAAGTLSRTIVKKRVKDASMRGCTDDIRARVGGVVVELTGRRQENQGTCIRQAQTKFQVESPMCRY
jgi:hypothetical protein